MPATIFSFLSSLLIVLTPVAAYGEGTYPWKDAHTLATLIVGAVLVIAFILYGMLLSLSLSL